jgi:hypothetical protein
VQPGDRGGLRGQGLKSGRILPRWRSWCELRTWYLTDKQQKSEPNQGLDSYGSPADGFAAGRVDCPLRSAGAFSST